MLDVCMSHCHYIVYAEQKKEDYDSSALTPGLKGPAAMVVGDVTTFTKKNH